MFVEPRAERSSETASRTGWTRWLARAVPWLAASVLIGLVVVNAWVGDDAAITARMVDNLLHGHGLRWNLSERVQAFTHPLWMLLLIPLMACGLSWYSSLTALGLAATSGAVFGLVRLSQRDAALGVLALSMLAFSRAFLDYSTSGLENPLAACLIVALVAVVPAARASARDVLGVACLVALLALTRLDLTILGLPACCYVMLQAVRAGAGVRAVTVAVALGMLPLVLWEIFSIVYYGFPFPNTAYAKLNTGIAQLELLRLGLDYFHYTLAHDSLTLTAALGCAAVVFVFRTGPAALALAGGAVAYYGYVGWIGGDFMGGRFFVAPLVMLVSLVVSRHVSLPRSFGVPGLAGVLVLGTASWSIPILKPVAVEAYGPLDERATYAKSTGLLKVWRGGAGVEHNWLRRGAMWRNEAAAQIQRKSRGPHYLYRHAHAVGMLGMGAGPDVHIIDHLALTDPLLARLPAAHDRVIQPGHFERMGQWSSKIPVTVQCPLEHEVCRFWRDYEQTLRTGVCVLDDANLCQYWRTLRTVTQGELFSMARWIAILDFNLGRFDHLIDRGRYRNASFEYPGSR